MECRSATELSDTTDGAYDLIITDPPFGGLLHYAELADFFVGFSTIDICRDDVSEIRNLKAAASGP